MPRVIAVKAVYSIVSYGKAGKPATARGSGGFSGAQLGGVMQRSQGVCVLGSRSQVQSTTIRSRLYSLAALRRITTVTILCLLLGCGMTHAQGVNTASLAGTVLDPSGAALKGAQVTVTNGATGSERSAISDYPDRYKCVVLPPGQYKISVEGGSNFEVHLASVTLTVGDSVIRDFKLALHGQIQSVEVIGEAANVETTKTDVSQTVQQREITNYPINGRSYINFTLTNSQTTRDVSPTIGPAPNSGLSIGGARARGTMVSVDGADAVDNSINAIRSTLSQEGIQEFQLILSNYNAEYGRASGGVINIVSKNGTNEFHGNAFGYFRNKAFQARNPFSGQVDPVTGNLDPIKQAYTRTQSGLTFGGPLKKDKTFAFFSYEYTQRQESGFSSIGTATGGGGPFGVDPLTGLTPAQEQFFKGAGAALGSAGQLYQAILASGSSVAILGRDLGLVAPALSGCALGSPGCLNPGPGPQFPLPVACPSGQIVNQEPPGGYPGSNCN